MKYQAKHLGKVEKSGSNKSFKRGAAVFGTALMVGGIVASTTNISLNSDNLATVSVGMTKAHADAIVHVQYGVLNQDMKDSTGYVYKTGTTVARASQNGFAGIFSLDLEINSGIPIGFGFGNVDQKYVTITGTKDFTNLTPAGTWIINNNYLTDAGRYETFTPVSDTSKDALVAAIAKANTYLNKSLSYTHDTVDKLNVAQTAANNVLNDSSATADQISTAAANIEAAISGLVANSSASSASSSASSATSSSTASSSTSSSESASSAPASSTSATQPSSAESTTSTTSADSSSAATAPASTASSSASSATTVTTQSGDTVSQIAADNGTTIAQIAKDNGLTDPNQIATGQKLVVNSAAAAKPTAQAQSKTTTKTLPQTNESNQTAYALTGVGIFLSMIGLGVIAKRRFN